MEPIDAATWNNLPAVLIGAVVTIVSAGVPVLVLYLRTLHAQLAQQYEELKRNSEQTAQVFRQTNGQLIRAINDAQTWRSAYERLKWIVQEVNATPEGRALIDRVMQRHRTVVNDADYQQLLARLSQQEPQQS